MHEQEDYAWKQDTFSSKTRKDTGINGCRKEDSVLCEALVFKDLSKVHICSPILTFAVFILFTYFLKIA